LLPTGRKNLVYTSITRAKKICIIVGTTKALAYAMHNMVVLKRNTRLKAHILLSFFTSEPSHFELPTICIAVTH
jgi:ATP-dependent exoDNAse (exonuclease V) alpha subunit